MTHSNFSFTFLTQVTAETEFKKLAEQEPWLTTTRLVVKPDMLFGKRGKSGLVSSSDIQSLKIPMMKHSVGSFLRSREQDFRLRYESILRWL